MRKIHLTAFLLSCFFIVGNAQQNAHFSQFMSNKLIQNPAYAGSADVLNFTALHRQQWMGLNGAPSTQTISLHAPIFNRKVGVGLSIIRDDITISENWDIITSYSYRIPAGNGTFSMGLQADLRFVKVNWDEVDALELNDQDIPTTNSQRFLPDIAAGLYYNTKRFYAGVAVQNLVNAKIDFNDDNLVDFLPLDDRHIYLMAGYVHNLSENVKLAPVALLKLVKNAPLDLDINASLIFYDRLWAGVSWRKDDSIDVILQYQVTQQMRIGVAYDFTISELQQVNSGSYEIMMQYDFNFDDSGFTNLRYF